MSIHAKDYHAEAIIFENLKPSRTYESNTYQAPEVLESKAPNWYVNPSLLSDSAKNLSKSGDYRVIDHLSWGQESLPISRASVFQVSNKDVTGSIKVYANDLLFVHLDLDVNGYRMTEKRRLKLNEEHYFDHPKFGVLLQVSRLEKSTKTKLEASK